MNRVSPSAVSYSKDLSFSFTKTLRGERVDFDKFSSYTYIIDVDGSIFQSAQANENQASVILVGGVNKFVNSKVTNIYSNFYITEQQKVTLYKIIKGLSEVTDDANITSDNDKLEQAINALYTNYCG